MLFRLLPAGVKHPPLFDELGRCELNFFPMLESTFAANSIRPQTTRMAQNHEMHASTEVPVIGLLARHSYVPRDVDRFLWSNIM